MNEQAEAGAPESSSYKEFYEKKLEDFKVRLSNLVSRAHDEVAQSAALFVKVYVEPLRDALENQADELRHFHELESHIKGGTLTDDLLKDIFARLNAARERHIEQNKKRLAEAASNQ